ncbi:LuxR C-terminal-related transcriptional regulator [Streptomyces sp. LP11]|uniref:LuxR C-terminal-related transcriptional regulator n=1 Tax=Streptomyces pyxinicus TaxID=2970331 RepID=A0ABT2ATV3_9ACTN|nr:LuxR family transcriptional regulator [Streptomyces sp. LP11]MCS0599683.1 LuxR C-terminal-related transcriptional regulator [Streptomyces sp. LP11]
MRTFEEGARAPGTAWPFTGREHELESLRAALVTGRAGIVVTGPPGHGKTRLLAEAVRGTDHARVTGTPEARHLPFAAFAHLLPDTVSPHRAVHLLSGPRLLVVDDAHLLDEASAALVHQLAVHGRTRLLVAAVDGVPAPGAVARLWTGELLPRLTLAPLPREHTARLLAADGLEALTAARLHRLCAGDLRLLRALVSALAAAGRLVPVPGTGERAWRGPLPLTPAVRDRLAALPDHPGARGVLERLAFAEPSPVPADECDLGVLEQLEEDGLIDVDDRSAVTLAHPLHGPALRAATGRLRARRLSPRPAAHGAALEAERRMLVRRMAEMDVRSVPTPVGEWLVAEDAPLPPGYAAARARYARLRGEVRDAAAWAREGLRWTAGDSGCLRELGLAAEESATEDEEVLGSYQAVRLGEPGRAAGRLPAGSVFARHAEALARGDGPGLDRAAEALRERGFLLFAAEAHAQAVRAHRDPAAARRSRARALACAARCQGARTPALAGLVLGELTARQRQIVTLAAAGLSNREIADRLTLSVRTVGNHLYGAYSRLGSGDRDALPLLLDVPERVPA